ncbi:MAG: type I restriction enzyme HsdR N-terminal domain-containing protein [Deferribacteres bacterium]|nr:type I restriction enzyme HsdR N-terminal domain-containing protein [candidate division KSB1 bacterium]MCB9508735.1 type I restriction enzyme HsdR N-terminal domain-containing protein [Deferribacteres bacterium]
MKKPNDRNRLKRRNIFCSLNALRNERSVEKNFAYRMVEWLGYSDEQIVVDESIEQIAIREGRRQELYRPDIVLFASERPRIIIEVKAPNRNVTEGHYQVASYALMMNQRFDDENPIAYCILTNGLETYIFFWDQAINLQYLEFGDWIDGNPKMRWAKEQLSHDTIKRLGSIENWRIGDRKQIEDLMALVEGNAISMGAIWRLFMTANAYPQSLGVFLEFPWHRKIYSELVDLGLIFPETPNELHYQRLIQSQEYTRFHHWEGISFSLTRIGFELVKKMLSSPELLRRYRLDQNRIKSVIIVISSPENAKIYAKRLQMLGIETS